MTIRRLLLALALLLGALPGRAALNVNNLYGFGAGSSEATVVFTDHAVDAVDRGTYTFTSRAIGDAASDRKVVVAVSYTTTASITSVTVGGITATQVVAATGSGGQKVELWQAAVPTGTTATIIVTHPGTSDRDGIGVWAVYGAQSAASATATSTGANPNSASLAIPSGGVAIGFCGNNQAGTQTYTWTNLSEDYDEAVESPTDNTGAHSTTTGTLTITCQESVGSTTGAMVLASWAAN